MDSLMVIHGLSQGCVLTTTTVAKPSWIYFLLHLPFMVSQHISVEIMVLKIYLWLLGWKRILVSGHISGDGKKLCTSGYLYSKLDYRSVHNIRIERLWVDVTAQVGATWAELFLMLEVGHGLNINNPNHIWLLHYLFLGTLNAQLEFFAQGWNHHRIQIQHGPNRSPADMFGFDMLTQGIRGTQLPTPATTTPMTDDELEVFGVDWDGLRDDSLLQSREANNSSTEGSSSWLGHSGPPEHLNEVSVEPPTGIFMAEELMMIDRSLLHLAGAIEEVDVARLWIEGLALARNLYPDLF
jgi:hypothetical protein